MTEPTKTPGQAAFEAFHPGCQWELLSNGERHWWNVAAQAVIDASPPKASLDAGWENEKRAHAEVIELTAERDALQEECSKEHDLYRAAQEEVSALTAERDRYRESIAAEQELRKRVELDYVGQLDIVKAERDQLRDDILKTKAAYDAEVARLRAIVEEAIDRRVADEGDVWEGDGEPPDCTPSGGCYDEVATRWWKALKGVSNG